MRHRAALLRNSVWFRLSAIGMFAIANLSLRGLPVALITPEPVDKQVLHAPYEGARRILRCGACVFRIRSDRRNNERLHCYGQTVYLHDTTENAAPPVQRSAHVFESR